MSKVRPISLRLSEQTDRLVTAEASAQAQKGSVIETLAEEALKARRVPGVGFAEMTTTGAPG